MKFSIIGGGMVGLCYLEALLEQGHALVGLCDVSINGSASGMVSAAGAQTFETPGPWLGESDVVVSAVYGMVAADVFAACLPYLKKGGHYVDMTTADPADMALCAERAKNAGVFFTDVAITGAVNLRGKTTPLLIAGAKADEVARLFVPMGADARVVGAQPGEAASLKLLRSIYTKGVEALAVECLVTAERMGLRNQLFEVLQDIDQTPLRTLLESMVRTHIPHAARRRNEVVEAREQMRLVGLQSVVSPAIEAIYSRTSQAQQDRPFTGESIEQALDWLTHNVLAASPARSSHSH